MSTEIRFSVDQDLSTGLFGDGGALQHDAAVLLAGQAWSRGRTPPAADTGTAVDALVHLAGRASLEAEGSELEWSTLSPDLGRTAHDWTAPVPWINGRAAWAVTDWKTEDSSRLLNVVRGVFSFSGYEGEVGEGHLAEEGHRSLARALEILVRTMPNLAANTLSLVRLLVVLRTDVPSWYLTQIPESIGLGESLLRRESDLVIAECLLHECLHEKYTLMRLVRALVRPGYSDHDSPGVLLPWSLTMGERRVFKVNRLLSTLHVYAHLSAFHSAVLRIPALDSHHAQAADRIRTSFERASYINRALQWTEVSCHLGGDGHALRDWLDRAALDFARETSDLLGLGLQAYPTGQWTHDDLIEV